MLKQQKYIIYEYDCQLIYLSHKPYDRYIYQHMNVMYIYIIKKKMLCIFIS